METIINNHIGSYGVIINNDKIVLIKKARGGYKGKLDLPGGGIEHNESVVDALKRELMEEAGIKVKNYKLLDVYDKTFTWNIKEDLLEYLHHIGIIYEVEIEEDTLKQEADGLDSEGAEWYLINELTKEDVTPFTWNALKKLNKI